MVTLEFFNCLIRLGLLDREMIDPITLVSLAEYIEAVENVYQEDRMTNEVRGHMKITYSGPYFSTTLGVYGHD